MKRSQHDMALLGQGGAHLALHMLVASGEEEEDLARRAPPPARRMEEEGAQGLGPGRPPRLMAEDGGLPLAGQPAGAGLGLGRLARPVNPLKDDEAPRHPPPLAPVPALSPSAPGGAPDSTASGPKTR